MGRPWKELEAEGVTRCCAMIRNRQTKKYRQCRARAVADHGWCKRHSYIEDVLDAHRAVVRAEADGSLYRKSEGDDDA